VWKNIDYTSVFFPCLESMGLPLSDDGKLLVYGIQKPAFVTSLNEKPASRRHLLLGTLFSVLLYSGCVPRAKRGLYLKTLEPQMPFSQRLKSTTKTLRLNDNAQNFSGL